MVHQPKNLQDAALKSICKDLIAGTNLWTSSNSIFQICAQRNVRMRFQKWIQDMQATISKLYQTFPMLLDVELEKFVVVEERKIDVPATLLKLREKKIVTHQLHAMICLAGGYEWAFLQSDPFFFLHTAIIEEPYDKDMVNDVCAIHKMLTTSARRATPLHDYQFSQSVSNCLKYCVRFHWTDGITFIFRIIPERLFLQDVMHYNLVQLYEIYSDYPTHPTAKFFCTEIFQTVWQGGFEKYTESALIAKHFEEEQKRQMSRRWLDEEDEEKSPEKKRPRLDSSLAGPGPSSRGYAYLDSTRSSIFYDSASPGVFTDYDGFEPAPHGDIAPMGDM
ncbi:hypothetical protein L596_017078 [Steinernema carpocapsae]|uniref:Uncharacterized protein n=1 Tax=Steinernema carpocapsae TaxID=34508 RepID=A0A4U5N1C2_STECR|nr:hypothetical protein L596_017078 [Steinernema carpocapsae]